MLNLDSFKDIPGFPGYKISNSGVVYSTKRNIIVAEAKNYAGYSVVTITDENGFRSPRKVHRLVYKTWVGELENDKVVDHRDDNKNNNYYTNLQQITSSQNSTKSFITGKNSEKVVWNKSMIHQICQMIVKNYPNKLIFETLGIDYESNRYNCNHLIGDLCRGTIHKDITIYYDLSKRVSGINKKDNKLSIRNVQYIYMMITYGPKIMTPAHVARYYSVRHSTICKIRDKKTWKIITDELDRLYKVEGSTTSPWDLWINRRTAQANGVGENPLNGNMKYL